MLDVKLIKTISAEVAREVMEVGTPASIALERAWRKHGVPKALYESVLAAQYKQISKLLGASTIEAAGSVAKAYEALLDSSEVSKYVSKASANMRLDVRKVITKVIKEGGSLTRDAVAMQEAAPVNPAVVRKDIKALVKNPITEKEAKALQRMINRGVKTRELNGQYQRVIEAAKKGDMAQVQKELDYAVQRKMRYNAERVLRTEQERAIGAAEAEEIAQDEDVKFVRFTLSPWHSVRDICDAYAEADMGYGKGVYPLDKAPSLPVHPNGKSTLEPVYVAKRTGKIIDPETAIKKASNGRKYVTNLIEIRPKITK